MVLIALGAPTGFVDFVDDMSYDLLAFIQSRGLRVFLGWMGRGVVQGCPLAALLFVIGAEPFAVLFKEVICVPRIGIVRLCAEDVGAALESIEGLKALFGIFCDAEHAAGLMLNTTKCVIVPLSSPYSLHLVEHIKLWLYSNLP